MDELTFKIEKQRDGWYLASPRHEKLGGATEAPDYAALKERVREFVRASLSDGFYNKVGLSANPSIRLIYFEPLYKNPAAEKMLEERFPLEQPSLDQAAGGQ